MSLKTLPVTVLTGFLGAGKTTLMRELLANPDGLKLGVLVNDFGEINIDSALVVEGTASSVSLANGCVCCTIQTELVEAVAELIRSRPDLDRIVIEASGVSRSLPLADTLASDEMAALVTLDGVFCVVDAAAFPELDFAATELAIDQITGSDLIVLNKTDLVTTDARAALGERLKGLTPHLRIVPASFGRVPRDILFGPARAERQERESHGHGNCGHHHHGPDCGCTATSHGDHHTDAFRSWSWRSAASLDESRLRVRLRALGPDLLRAKGILTVRQADGSEAAYEFQQVGRRSRLVRLERPPLAESLLVAIGLAGQIDADAFTAALDACVVAGAPAGEAKERRPAELSA